MDLYKVIGAWCCLFAPTGWFLASEHALSCSLWICQPIPYFHKFSSCDIITSLLYILTLAKNWTFHSFCRIPWLWEKSGLSLIISRCRYGCKLKMFGLGQNCYTDLAPVVRPVDNAIHWVNLYPEDSAIGFPNIHPLDSDLSTRSTFEQPGLLIKPSK